MNDVPVYDVVVFPRLFYFRSTFMWYHTDVNGRILESAGRQIDPKDEEVELGGSNSTTLQHLSAKAIISAKLNFFAAPDTLFPNKIKNGIAVLSGQVYRNPLHVSFECNYSLCIV